MAIDRENTVCYRYLAQAYLEGGEEEKARQSFVKTLDYGPDDVKSRFVLAGIYRDREEYEKALDQYRRVVTLREGLARGIQEYAELESKSHREMALIYERQEEDGSALHHWGEYDRLMGGSVEAQQHRDKLRLKVYEETE